MQVVLPEEALPVKLALNPELQMNDDEYYEFCMANSDLWIERTESGEIIITPPSGAEASYQSVQVAGQLSAWAKRDGQGKAFGPTEFILPNRAALSPDAAWVSNTRLSALSKSQKRKFLPVCPEFVVEVMSPSDRLRAAKEKMESWMRGSVDLGWLIHPDDKTVYVYRAGQKERRSELGSRDSPPKGPSQASSWI